MAISATLTARYDVAALREHEFPITRDSVYLNHAGVSPLPRRTVEAMREVNERLMLDPLSAFGPWLIQDMIPALSDSLVRLIHAASPEEVVPVQTTSLGLGLLAQAMPWRHSENVVLCDVEFPSNVYPWMRLTDQHGVEARLIPARDGGLTLDAVRAAVDAQTRVVAASSVQFLTGHRTDLAAIGAFCHERGILFMVDAIQSVGHIPIDVQGMHIAALAAGGQKSLLGPPGQGFLYVSSALAPDLRPTVVGANAVEDWIHWLRYDLTPSAGAARFMMGTPSVAGYAGLLASVGLLLELGVAAIDEYTTALAAYAIDRLREAGYRVITPAAHGPIVTFQAAPDDARTSALMAALAARRIFLAKHWDAQDNAYLRLSVHCYNTPEDIDTCISALQEAGAA